MISAGSAAISVITYLLSNVLGDSLRRADTQIALPFSTDGKEEDLWHFFAGFLSMSRWTLSITHCGIGEAV